MNIRIPRWEWNLGGTIALGGLLEWWFKDFMSFPHLLVVLFWLVILRIILFGIGQLWDVLTGKHIDQTGKELDEFVDDFQKKIKHQIEETGRDFLKGNTIDDYRKAHPESFEGKEFKACHNCGDRSIWVKQMGITRYGIHNQHICRTCGTALWRSNL
ncbi:hypothetical protein Q666_16840 [Marinobacter sp. ES-1]|uniref:hypothetical protein n=1 Tax=Marinobacter sp. ES-1 TaxID=1396858 RepID=UPI0003B90339|nr:hypothetical protein [Marinobacter sp. ES-1]ERP98968.1 hypothetical protein Q666_16840 [Marinobacter sp. ES-1]